ncbi:unnamed protein product [Orchesella dallaii]|uniref:Uncharacterized protein n=1 Tax=Orchesella dallaii TaxID=48710 RepID=A0ABP1QAP2_9HEXA
MILNLNLYLSLFSNCFINIVTYHDLNFLPLEHPVVLSDYDYASGKTFATNESETHLDLKNCETNILIVTSKLLSKLSQLKKPFHFNIRKRFEPPRPGNAPDFFRSSLLLTRMCYDVLISRINLFQPYVEHWIDEVTETSSLNPTHPTRLPSLFWEILYFNLEIKASRKGLMLMGEINYIITTVDLLCHHCSPQQVPFQPQKIHRFGQDPPITQIILQMIISKMNSNTNNIVWHMVQFHAKQESGTFKYPESQNNRQFFWNGNEFHKWNDERRLYHVFGNASYCATGIIRGINPRNNRCRPKIKYRYPLVIYEVAPSDIPIHWPFHHKQLKWVSCGHLPGKLPYLEILSPYTVFAWLIIFFVVFALPCIYLHFQRLSYRIHIKTPWQGKWTTTYSGYFLGCLKPLVDQGPDEISTALDSSASFRISFIIYLLMVIILSNGYKGENITKLVSPIPPIPFTTFEQLVSENYDIINQFAYFSAQTNISMTASFLKRIPTFLQKNNYNYSSKGFHDVLLVDYDNLTGTTFSVKLATDLLHFMTAFQTRTLSAREKYILKHTRMNTEWQDDADWSWAAKTGLSLLFDNCSDSNKLAVVAEKPLTVRFHKIYSETYGTDLGFDYHLSFGKDVLASMTRGVAFRSWVNPKVVDRMIALRSSSGIMDWYENLEENDYKGRGSLVDMPEHHVFRPMTLTTSFKLVFEMWMGGVVIAFISLFVESLCCNWLRRYFSDFGRYIRRRFCNGVSIL